MSINNSVNSMLISGMKLSINQDVKNIVNRVKINSGSHYFKDSSFSTDAYLPNNDWRSLTDDEVKLLSDRCDESVTKDERITIFTIPQQIIKYYSFLKKGAEKYNEEKIIQNLFSHPDTQRGKLKLLYLCQKAGLNEDYHLIENCTIPTGLAVTSKGVHGKYVGLHIDSWDGGSISDRINGTSKNRNRLCINVGSEDRYFLFINIDISQIKREFDFSFNDNPNKFVVDFLSNFSNYPVMKVRIKPGEAYIAPTESIIHDSTTLDKKFIDLPLTILGYFDEKVEKNLISISKELDSL